MFRWSNKKKSKNKTENKDTDGKEENQKDNSPDANTEGGDDGDDDESAMISGTISSNGEESREGDAKESREGDAKESREGDAKESRKAKTSKKSKRSHRHHKHSDVTSSLETFDLDEISGEAYPKTSYELTVRKQKYIARQLDEKPDKVDPGIDAIVKDLKEESKKNMAINKYYDRISDRISNPDDIEPKSPELDSGDLETPDHLAGSQHHDQQAGIVLDEDGKPVEEPIWYAPGRTEPPEKNKNGKRVRQGRPLEIIIHKGSTVAKKPDPPPSTNTMNRLAARNNYYAQQQRNGLPSYYTSSGEECTCCRIGVIVTIYIALIIAFIVVLYVTATTATNDEMAQEMPAVIGIMGLVIFCCTMIMCSFCKEKCDELKVDEECCYAPHACRDCRQECTECCCAGFVKWLECCFCMNS